MGQMDGGRKGGRMKWFEAVVTVTRMSLLPVVTSQEPELLFP